jgi:hypothetical protein
MNLVIKGKCTSSYDAVYKDFIELSETRAKCCDESKTTISKIDNNNFVVPERAEVIKKNGIANEMFQFSSL